MSRQTILVLTLSLIAIPLFAQTPDSPRLRIRTGLWETTIVSKITGQIPIPNDALARLTPAQRQQLEATMESKTVRSPQPKTVQICITQEKLDKGFRPDGSANNPNCKRTVVWNTTDEMEVHEVCTDTSGTTDVTIHYQAISPETIQGITHLQISRQGKNMVSDGSIQGKWLAASCGAVK